MTAATLLLLAAATAARGQPASAAPVDTIIPGLHNSGVDDGDKKLNKGEPDRHFKVTGPLSGTPVVIGPNDIPDDWINRQDSSQWISIADDTVAPEGTYRYQMKFDLTGFDPDSVRISGMWGVDNVGAEIRLNGKSTGIVNDVGPGDYSSFTLDRGFVAGENTLEFVVPNLGSGGGARKKPDGGGDEPLYTGLRFQLTSVEADRAETDLAIDKSHDGAFAPGGTGTYEITVSSVGDAASSGDVTVSDTLPTGLTPTAATGTGWACTIKGQSVSCTRDDALAPGKTYPTITITVDVAPTATSVTNTAKVDLDGDSNSSNNSADDPTTIAGAADLSIEKRHDAQFQQGKSGTYRIDVENDGDSPSSGTVTVRDDVPAGLTPTAASGTGWTCQIQGQVVTCTRSDVLAAGKAYPPITLAVEISPTASTLTNVTTVSGGGDTNDTNNSASDRTVIGQAKRDLAIAKTHAGDFSAGDKGRTFTITVSNVGDTASTGTVTVTDTAPGGLTPTAVAGTGWTCSIAGATATCSRADALAAGAAFPAITLTVDVADNASDLVNVASVKNDSDTNSANNSAQDPIAIVVPDPTSTPDLSITKSHDGQPLPGQQGFSFEIVVRNRGGSASSGRVTVSDPFPAGFTPANASGSGWDCRISGARVTCERDDALAANRAYPTITIKANVATDAEGGENVATVTGGSDTNTANNSARDLIVIDRVVVVPPDLIITKSHTGTFERGESQAFLIDVRNGGDGATTAIVTVTDTLPAGLKPTEASGTGWSCSLSGQTATCSRSSVLVSGAKYPTITLEVDVLSSAQSATNTARVAGGGETSAETENNTATDAYVVGGNPDLTITKSHTGDLQQGQTGAQYSVVVRNAGQAPTSGEVTVRDVVPDGLVARAASGTGWTCSVSTAVVSCRRSDALASGDSWPAIAITVDVEADADDLVNTATVSGGGDTTPGNNSASDPSTVSGRPQLTITKHHPTPVVRGQDVTFTITVANNGAATTTGAVTVTDPVPAGLAVQSVYGDGWRCTAGASTSCTRADRLAAGSAFPAITLVASVDTTASTVVNTAVVDGGGDTTPEDNTARDQVAIATPGVPNLTIDKTHSGKFAQGQSGARYTIVVRNQGGAPTSGTVTVKDTLPSSLTPENAAGDGWNCFISGRTVSCSRSDVLPPSRSWPAIDLTVAVGSDAPSPLVNTATVSGGGDETPDDNSDTDEVVIDKGAPDLTITKRHDDPFRVGQQDASYVITVTNVGSAATTGEVNLSDRVPAGLRPVQASGERWTCTIAGQNVACHRSDGLKPGASYPRLTIRVEVLPEAVSGTNVATISGGGDDNDDNNNAYDPTTLGPLPDLTITLSPETPVVAGGEAEYRGVTQNVGGGASVGPVVVVSRLSDTLTPLMATGSGWACQVEGQNFRCATRRTIGPQEELPPLSFRVAVSAHPAPELVASGQVIALVDADPDNNEDELRTSIEPATAELRITQVAIPGAVEIGGSVAYGVALLNAGTVRLADAVVEDILPRGFLLVDGSGHLISTITRASGLLVSRVDLEQTERGVVWRAGTLEPGERLILQFRTIVGADARPGTQRAVANAVARVPGATSVTAGPAPAEVRVLDQTFSMRQVLVGRVYEDADGDGSFGDGDRGVAGTRVIISTGQAAITDGKGLYNLPSLASGSVAVSLDPGTVPATLTLAADGPGGSSWSRLLRTPIGGGALLRQDFRLVAREPVPAAADSQPAAAPSAPSSATTPVDTPPSDTPPTLTAGAVEDPPLSEIDRLWPGDQQDVTGGAKPPIPPRRDYESRQGPAMMLALGELSIGRAAPEFELFGEDGDAWGYGSLFYQGSLGSEKNRLTLSYDSRRHLNSTAGDDRLFELDGNDRVYPVLGDSSTREELAQSNSRLFARLERGRSYVMFGDLIGDLPESNNSGGRLSSYARHVTGVEGRVAGDSYFVAVRGARPTTAFARDVFTGSDFGYITLSRPNIVAGTETVSLEVRDRRAPERILSRQVLARNVDYRMQAASGTLTLLRDAGGLNGNLDLVQVVATYEYEGTGTENMLASGRASKTLGSFTIGASAFTEEPDGESRFSVAGVDASVRLPNAGRLRVDVPYSRGTPEVSTAFDNVVGPTVNGPADGFAVSADLDQPLGTRAAVRASYLQADEDYANPFAATTTPGARYGRAEGEIRPFEASRLLVGVTNERNETANVDNERNTLSASWEQKLSRGFSFDVGYAARWLDDNRGDTSTDSGLASGALRFKAARFEAMVRREENVGDDDDPTYPTQTLVGARFAVADGTSLVYSQRISDAPIRPIGDLTGFSSLDSTNELNIGLESRVWDATRLTSRYQVEGGINGPDAFAVIGAQNRFDLGKGLFADVGVEHGQAVEGDTEDFTSGRIGLAWLRHDLFKASARYELRDRDGFAGFFTGGAAGRIVSGLTGIVRLQWLNDGRAQAESGYDVLAGVAVRPTGSDAVGLLVSYRVNDSTRPAPIFNEFDVSQRQDRLSTDGYWRPLGWLELYGKGAWQRLEVPVSRQVTDTYLFQARTQLTFSRWVDVALEDRWLWQPVTDSSRTTVAAEIGVWPIADLRLGLGYNFRDTTDPFERDQQGRPRGAYFTLSTKLAHLFDLLGSTPAPAAER